MLLLLLLLFAIKLCSLYGLENIIICMVFFLQELLIVNRKLELETILECFILDMFKTGPILKLTICLNDDSTS